MYKNKFQNKIGKYQSTNWLYEIIWWDKAIIWYNNSDFDYDFNKIALLPVNIFSTDTAQITSHP